MNEISIIITRKGTDSIGDFVTTALVINGELVDTIETETFVEGLEFWMRFLNNRR